MEVEIPVAPAGQNDGVGSEEERLPGDEFAGDHSCGPPLGHHELEHLRARPQDDPARPGFAYECGRRSDLELEARLAPRVEGAGDLDAPEGARRQGPAVLPSEGDSECRHVVDDPGRLLCESEQLQLTGAEVPAFECVLDESGQGVPVDAPPRTALMPP